MRTLLSNVDAAWHRMEEPANRMVVTGVLIFESPLPMKRLRALLESRLLVFPRFHQRVVQPLGGLGLRFWEEDPDFSVDHHLVSARLPAPGDEEALQAFTSELASRPFPKGRPPWQLHFVPHFQKGSALIARLHHCIGDGLALVHVLLSMADGAPEPPAPGPESTSLPGSRESVPAWLAGVTGAALALPSRVGAEALALLRSPDRLVRSGAEAANHLASLVRLLLLPPDPPTSFKGELGKKKRLVWSRPYRLEDFKAVGSTTGSTVNDVLMTALAGALRRSLATRGQVTEDLDVRGVVPVNLRPPSEAHLLGNRFGLVFLALPLGIRDTLARLEELQRRMQALKKSPDAAATFQLLWAMGPAPRPLFDLVIDLFAAKATAVVTNVIGPREPISIGGVRVRQAMFWVPCAGHLGLGVSLLSYAGRVWVGVHADARLIPDPEAILAGFDAELRALREVARRAG